MTFGEKIKQIRESMGLSQIEFATLCKTTGASIARYERGEYYPRINTFFHIAKCLNMTASELLDGVEYEL